MNERSILVTGASSGIGRALALAYARRGVRLALIGRDADRLRAVAAAASEKGAEVRIGRLDVRDQAAMADWITARDAELPFDLVIANAGITTGLGPQDAAENPGAVRAILGTNLMGVFNTVEPVIGPMCARGRGRLAFVGSIAGLRGLPYAPAYSAAKAAVHAYTEALRGRLEPRGVRISLIVAGFVKTPLNDSIDGLKPFEVSDAEAARLIKRGLDRDKAVIVFPWPLYLAARLARTLPVRLIDQIMGRFEVNVPETHERLPRSRV
jgi:short-subunit dehydrogenase